MESSTKASTEQLEQEIQELLDQETFDPPEDFVEHALIADESVYEEAAKDPVAWWEKQAEALHWFERWDDALDESNAPFYKWFTGGKVNASYNCLDRHVEDGKGDKVAFHWRGEEGEERDVTYEELLRDTKKLANALKDQGIEKGDVVGIYLPMIPEVVVAMLASRPHRRAPQLGVRRLFAGLGKGEDGVLGGEGADPRHPGPPQGQGRGHQVRGGR